MVVRIKPRGNFKWPTSILDSIRYILHFTRHILHSTVYILHSTGRISIGFKYKQGLLLSKKWNIDIKEFQRSLLYMYIVHHALGNLRKKTRHIYIFSTVLGKKVYFKRKEKFFYYSLFTNIEYTTKLKYILQFVHWAYKEIKMFIKTLLLFPFLSK